MFKPTIWWLKSFLIKNNYKEIANQIDDDWCWKELGKFSKKAPKKVRDLVAREVIKSGNGWVCYAYCRHIEDRDDVREVLIKSGNGRLCYLYCLYIEDRDDVREALIKSGDGMVCSWYCRNVEDRKDVRTVAERGGYLV